MKNSLKTILVVVLISINTGCAYTNSVSPSDGLENIEKDERNSNLLVPKNNYFNSIDNKTSFNYAEDWLCKEVLYGVRVDCYPETREVEQYDAGFDEFIVPYPEITILIDKCDSKSLSEFEVSGILKKYRNCNTLVITTKEDFESFIWN